MKRDLGPRAACGSCPRNARCGSQSGLKAREATGVVLVWNPKQHAPGGPYPVRQPAGSSRRMPRSRPKSACGGCPRNARRGSQSGALWDREDPRKALAPVSLVQNQTYVVSIPATFSKVDETFGSKSLFRIYSCKGAFSLAKSPLLPLRGNSPEKSASQDKAFRAHLALRARLRRVALETLRCGSQCGARRGRCPSTPQFFEKN